MKGATRLVAQRQQRIALVIGNGSYREDPLANPVNDATDMAKVLRELGFEVILLKELDKRAMADAVEDFSRQLRPDGVGVFYYAGHGVQVNGENYLVPLRAQLNRQKDVEYDAYPLGKVLNVMEAAKTQVNIVIIDACRDNPFYRRWRSTRGSTSVRGLSEVDLPPEGTIIAFSTAPGNFAEDGQDQRNSPFTSNLLKQIQIPGLEVFTMFRRVREGVLKETDGQQRPWIRESLIGGSFFFKPTIEQPTTLPPQQRPSPITAVPQPTPSPPTPISQPGTTLISKATGVDYSPLRDLLEAGKWKEADVETTRAMLQAAGRKKEGGLSWDDIDNFSCEDLRIIDQLWLESSQGKFGFSVQKDIYQGLEDFWMFRERVGWGDGLDVRRYDDLTFNLNAPKGQLPRHHVGLREGTYNEGDRLKYRAFTVRWFDSEIKRWLGRSKEPLPLGYGVFEESAVAAGEPGRATKCDL